VALGEITFDEAMVMLATAGVDSGLGTSLLRTASIEAALVALVEKEITVKGLFKVLTRVCVNESTSNVGECDQLVSISRRHLTRALEAGVCDIDEALVVFASFGISGAAALDMLAPE